MSSFFGYDVRVLALVRGETSSVANPKLVFAYINSGTTSAGRIMSPYSLEFEVRYQDGSVHTVRRAVDLVTEAIECGYAPTITFVVLDLLGNYRVNWFAKLTATSDEDTWTTEFPLLAVGTPIPDGYATIAMLRAEGVPVAFADARLALAIEVASRRIESICQRFFEPRFQKQDFDGAGGPMLLLEDPIIGVCDISYIFDSTSTSEIPVVLDNLKIYNRHMRGMTHPDDRDNPKVEFIGASAMVGSDYYSGEEYSRYSGTYPQTRFSEGQQNVRITGWFGYTDPDSSPFGSTPALISYVCVLMAMREVRPKWDTFGTGTGSGSHGNLTLERTRDQTVEYERGIDATFKAGITGDPTIDQILQQFMVPLRLGAA